MEIQALKDLLNAPRELELKGEVVIVISEKSCQESLTFAEIIDLRDKFFPNISLDKISVHVQAGMDTFFDNDNWIESNSPYFILSLKLVK